MRCDFVKLGDVMRCRNCGRTLRVVDPMWGPERYNAQCGVTTGTAMQHTRPREPGMVRKVYSRCLAMAKWRMAGSPTRTADEIAALLVICTGCDKLLDAGSPKQRCGACGCPVNSNMADTNKLYLATETCPLQKWS